MQASSKPFNKEQPPLMRYAQCFGCEQNRTLKTGARVSIDVSFQRTHSESLSEAMLILSSVPMAALLSYNAALAVAVCCNCFERNSQVLTLGDAGGA